MKRRRASGRAETGSRPLIFRLHFVRRIIAEFVECSPFRIDADEIVADPHGLSAILLGIAS